MCIFARNGMEFALYVAMRWRQQKGVNGFSLIELMIVVAVVAILVAIAIPEYKRFVYRSHMAEGTILIDEITKEMLTWYSEHDKYPGFNELGYTMGFENGGGSNPLGQEGQLIGTNLNHYGNGPAFFYTIINDWIVVEQPDTIDFQNGALAVVKFNPTLMAVARLLNHGTMGPLEFFVDYNGPP